MWIEQKHQTRCRKTILIKNCLVLIYIVKNILRDQWAAKLLVLYKQRTSYPEEPSAKKKNKNQIYREQKYN